MNYTKIKALISAEALLDLVPLSTQRQQDIAKHRQEIKQILAGADQRLLLIVGPCSAWPMEAVWEYAKRLAQLNDMVKHRLKLVMRVYPHKSRTALGWSGAIFQPDPCKAFNISEGLIYTRKMMVEVIELGLPIAAEALYTQFYQNYWDLISWIAVGARSSESHEHRVFASSVDIPVGLKNPTHGSLRVATNSIISAQNAHPTIVDGYESQTHGNPYAHLVLRGGNNQPNHSLEHLQFLEQLLREKNIKNPSVIIDVSHDNTIIDGVKDYQQQPHTIAQILETIAPYPALQRLIKGFMVESFIKAGRQDINRPEQIDRGGLSITDACIGWEETEALIFKLAQ